MAGLRLGDRVLVNDCVTGVVVGVGTAREKLVWLIALDGPDWIADRSLFISTIVADPSNVKPFEFGEEVEPTA